jgi:hypothetical protein
MPRPKLVDRASGVFAVPVVIDTRAQTPFAFEGLRCDAADGGGPLTVPTVRGTLKSGDYSLKGHETRVAVERKSLADLFGTLGKGRERFERELARLSTYRFAAVVVEGDWRAILDAYPAGLVEVKAQMLRLLQEGDRSQPWGQWLAWLNEATPGPPARSELNPKTVYRSILAWQVRYPVIHWEMCPDRRFAEVTTFRLLERYLKEDANREHDPDADPGVPAAGTTDEHGLPRAGTGDPGHP